MRKIREEHQLSDFSYWMVDIRKMNKDFMSRCGKYMERDTEVKRVESAVELVKPSHIIPRLPTDYSKTVIYKIVCNDLNILGCYVGHTTDFTRRKACHKSDCHNEKRKNYNLKVYKTIRENCGWNNYSMIEIEKHSCKDENEASAKEREWFERLNSGLNTNVPNRSDQEYKADNRAETAIYNRQYNEEHKEEMATKRKQTFTCECGKTITWGEKTRHFKTKFHKHYIESIMLATIPVVQVVPPITNTH
jgi:hypothetical protein